MSKKTSKRTEKQSKLKNKMTPVMHETALASPDALFSDIRSLIYQARKTAFQQIDKLQVITNFEIGRRIVEHEQKGEVRAKYGKAVLEELSKKLKAEFGRGYSRQNLYSMRTFYLTYRSEVTSIFQAVPGKLSVDALSECFKLSWTHYLILLGLKNPEERRFYEVEAVSNGWVYREMERQIQSALYERLALSRDKKETRELSKGQIIETPRDMVKDPYVLEFLGLKEEASYSEGDLETAIIDKLEHFLLELGKGFLFEARQKRFSFDEDHFCVDLVFYNRLLHCYVLIDLKLDKLTHQDLGQMQMYVNYFDRFVKTREENPTVGIVLCKRKKDALIELTLPKNANIFASAYQLYLPSKEELRRQLEEAVQDIEIHWK